MQASYTWNKFYLHGPKIILFAVLMLAAQTVSAQRIRYVRTNNPNYDRRKLSYGFLIGLHTSTYQIKYADKFVTPAFDTVYAVQPLWSGGFALGFIVNYKLAEFLDLRLTPDVAFYENRVRYSYTKKQPSSDQLAETVMVEFPLLLKYKSERRGNVRMYMVGGIKPAIEASGKKDIENSKVGLEVKGSNVSLEAGFGFDLYFPLFKFSPEIRFSRGISNILSNTTNIYGQPISRINTNTITLYLLFQ